MRLNICGTKITISFLFLSIIVFMFFIDKTGFMIPMAVSVFLHETAHLTCMYFFRCQPKEIKLIPGGIEIIRDFCFKKQAEILISLSGPFVNFILFILFYNFSIEFALINLSVCVFNMLPLTTLDGGEILKIILGYKIGEDKAKNVLTIFNIFLGIFGISIGVFLFLNKIPNISLIILSIYLILSVIIKI